MSYEVVESAFAPALRQTLDQLDGFARNQVVPVFALVDPFGVSGLPFELIARLLRRQSCEVLITFMTEPIKRFVEVEEVASKLPALFGVPDAAALIAASPDRVVRARELYAAQLRTVARYVRFFVMRNSKDVPIYDLFFASNNPRGFEKMKEAMWKIDESGDYAFSDGIGPGQRSLFRGDVGRYLALTMLERFASQEVTSELVLEWVCYESDYLAPHGREALKLLESTGVDGRVLSVNPVKRDGTKRRRGTFPPGVVLRFP